MPYIYLHLFFEKVEKDRFLMLVQNFTSLAPEEAEELVALQNTFPYSQIIHNLAARASRDHNLDSQELNLHLSAVYATDRAILKTVMTLPGKPRMELTKDGAVTPTTKKTETLSDFTLVKEPTSPELLWEELALDLDKLKELKLNFETQFTNPAAGNGTQVVKKKVEGPKVEESAKPIELIDEIKSSKKKIKPETSKQKAQLEIIDEFIKTKPTISKGKLTPPSPGAVPSDLSESSIVFTENIISETLVDLLLRQGKRDKAIDVLKKLIWKFPQKKAYFAAQIEELKK